MKKDKIFQKRHYPFHLAWLTTTAICTNKNPTAQARINHWGPERFAAGLWAAVWYCLED